MWIYIYTNYNIIIWIWYIRHFNHKLSDSNFESVGAGWCRPKGCDVNKDTCRVNGYYKNGTNYQDCRATCLNESTCTGFAISEHTFDVEPNRCFIYGNISFNNELSGWIASPSKYFDIHTSYKDGGGRCYKMKIKGNNFY